MTRPNEVDSADGSRPVLFAFATQWPVVAEFFG